MTWQGSRSGLLQGVAKEPARDQDTRTRRGARPEDFDRIGTEYHRWFRETDQISGSRSSDDYLRFIEQDFNFYSRWYLRLMDASNKPLEGLEEVLYNAHHGFTHQYMLLLAPLGHGEPDGIVSKNSSSLQNSSTSSLHGDSGTSVALPTRQRSTRCFNFMRDIRGLDPEGLAAKASTKC